MVRSTTMKKLVLAIFLTSCAHTPYVTESVIRSAPNDTIEKKVMVHNPTECTSVVGVECPDGFFNEGESNRYFTLVPYGVTSAVVTVPSHYSLNSACYVEACYIENGCSDSMCAKPWHLALRCAINSDRRLVTYGVRLHGPTYNRNLERPISAPGRVRLPLRQP